MNYLTVPSCVDVVIVVVVVVLFSSFVLLTRWKTVFEWTGMAGAVRRAMQKMQMCQSELQLYSFTALVHRTGCLRIP